jgi:FAD/FMN-containing dehydrogenase
MIGNNSCGVHALMGGMTSDNVEAMEILLYDGTRMRVGRHNEDEVSAIIRSGGRQGEIYSGLRQIRDRYARLIRERLPQIPRRVSGHSLDQLLPENGFHVARALVGSEGTCVTIPEAECELKPSPQHGRLVALGFADAFVAADHVPAVLACKPIGLEGFDGLLVKFMLRKKLALRRRFGRAILILGTSAHLLWSARISRCVCPCGGSRASPMLSQRRSRTMRGDCSALHALHFRRVHKTLRVMPAMEAGLAGHVWEIEDLVGLLDDERERAAA